MSVVVATVPAFIHDLHRAMEFYRALFGWEYLVGPAMSGHYTMCLLHDRPVAAIMPNPEPDATDFWWNVYFATDDCDRTATRIADAGGTVLTAPMDVMDHGRMAIASDPVGAQFGLWQGRSHIGCQVVNEPNSLVRNDLVTPHPELVRDFYAAVFDFTLDRNEDLPDFDFTFLRSRLRTPTPWRRRLSQPEARQACPKTCCTGGLRRSPIPSAPHSR